MKNITVLATCILSICMIQATAQAKPGKGGKGLDTNGDGVVSYEEAEAAGAERLIDNFADIDSDGSGDVTREEMRAHREERRAAHKEKIKSADSDGNGAISYDEANTANLEKLVENFDRLDLDGDGEVTREEMRERRQGKKGSRQSETI